MSSQLVVERQSTSWIRSSILSISFWWNGTSLLGLVMGCILETMEAIAFNLPWTRWLEMMCVICVHSSKKSFGTKWGGELSKVWTLLKICVFMICVFVTTGIGGPSIPRNHKFFLHKSQILRICVFVTCDLWFLYLCNLGNAPFYKKWCWNQSASRSFYSFKDQRYYWPCHWLSKQNIHDLTSCKSDCCGFLTIYQIHNMAS